MHFDTAMSLAVEADNADHLSHEQARAVWDAASTVVAPRSWTAARCGLCVAMTSGCTALRAATLSSTPRRGGRQHAELAHFGQMLLAARTLHLS